MSEQQSWGALERLAQMVTLLNKFTAGAGQSQLPSRGPLHRLLNTHPLASVISRPNFVSSLLSVSLLCMLHPHCFLFDSALENTVTCQVAIYSSNTSLLRGPVAGWH